jgi:ribokinase
MIFRRDDMRDDPLPRIIVVGSVNIDFTVYVPHLPRPGETLGGEQFMVAPGGKAGNQAIAAARLGANVSLIACVGDDEFGPRLRASLEADRIDCAGVSVIPNCTSGIAMVVVDPTGCNSIVTVEGSNGKLTPELAARHLRACPMPRLILCELTMPMSTVKRILAMANEARVPVLLNASPVRGVLPAHLLNLVEYLVVNEVEAAILSGQPLDSVEDAMRVARALQTAGARNVLVTLGAKGAVTCFAAENEPRIEFLPAEPVVAIDSTGAGDTFAGAFATAIVAGVSNTKAVKFAQSAAAICVTRTGAAPSIPYLRELPSTRL